MGRRLLCSLGCCFTAATLAAVSAAGAAAPSSLVLQESDVPTNLVVAVSKTVSNAEIVREYPLTLKQLGAWGRLTGYRIEFGSTHKPTRLSTGPLAIKSSVSVCRTSFGAHAYYLNGRNAIPVGSRSKLALSLGAESLMASTTEVDHGLPLVLYSIGWRDGRYLASVLVSGIRGRLKPAEVIALARTQERKISAAAH